MSTSMSCWQPAVVSNKLEPGGRVLLSHTCTHTLVEKFTHICTHACNATLRVTRTRLLNCGHGCRITGVMCYAPPFIIFYVHIYHDSNFKIIDNQ